MSQSPKLVRIGDAERDQAVTMLREHLAAGRLTEAEFGDREAMIPQSRYLTDLQALFRDLPEPQPGQELARQSPTPPAQPHDRNPDRRTKARDATRPSSSAPTGASTLSHRLAAVSPFLATVLFFAAGFGLDAWEWCWLFFLLIPASFVWANSD